MATFADFPSNAMAHDFPLYSYPDSSWPRDDDPLPSSSADPSYLSSTNTAAAAYPEPSFDPSAFDAFAMSHADHFAFAYPPQPALALEQQPQQQQHSHPHQANHLRQHLAAKRAPHDSPAARSIDYGQQPPVLSSTSDSGASAQSSISSAMGSPAVHPQFAAPHDWAVHAQHHHHHHHPHHPHSALLPEIVSPDFYAVSAANANAPIAPAYDLHQAFAADTAKGCVDPSLIQPTFSPTQFTGAQFPELHGIASPPTTALTFPQAPSPAPSHTSIRSPRVTMGRLPGSRSPYLPTRSWEPYPGAGAACSSRRHSVSSIHSRHSQHSAASSSEESNKGQCPIATCGRHVKDLKAHMLTHQHERPEKCPIPTCEYHTKGFARKYDKNRHTLTHYKGTMVCGFCPGSGSAAEKSFNRADVFKRHLTSVHGVEQTPPNARKKGGSAASSSTGAGGSSSSAATTPAAIAKRAGGNASTPALGGAANLSGTCSTCHLTFANAQDFYEHLDDCVLRVVQQADPSEAINEKLLASLADDPQVRATMAKHLLPTDIDYSAATSFGDEEEEDEDVDDDDDEPRRARKASTRRPGLPRTTSSSTTTTQPQPSNRPRKGLTYSQNGVPLYTSSASDPTTTTAGKPPKRRKNHPLSWGAAPDKMKIRKRVLCVYDGRRRLWKDDMMLDASHEVRLALPMTPPGSGAEEDNHHHPRRDAWVTDLDVATLNRAEAIHGATAEERGEWVDEDADEFLA